MVLTAANAASPRPRGSTQLRDQLGDQLGGFPASAGIDLTGWCCHDPARRLPRVRGDRPFPSSPMSRLTAASPRPRGSTRCQSVRHELQGGFPASAGIDPHADFKRCGGIGLPRVRGDRPVTGRLSWGASKASPRPRGSTFSSCLHQDRRSGFPASAGIDPVHTRYTRFQWRLPRVRGDRPLSGLSAREAIGASPRPRGSTGPGPALGPAQGGFPASAGIDLHKEAGLPRPHRLPRVRGDRPPSSAAVGPPRRASPRPRGSTPHPRKRILHGPGFPASAGIDPHQLARRSRTRWLPRVRGDRPVMGESVGIRAAASPRPRGSTVIVRRDLISRHGFPASAGIDPWPSPRCGHGWRLPRVRGDRPQASLANPLRFAASPRPRGSTRRALAGGRRRHGFPASAGIDPRPIEAKRSASWLPRVRGDRPRSQNGGGSAAWASPRPRGSTRRRRDAIGDQSGFPASAGIDPRSGR